MKKFLIAMTAVAMTTSIVNAESYDNTTTVRGTVLSSVPHYHNKTVKVPSTKCTIKDIPIYSKNKGRFRAADRELSSLLTAQSFPEEAARTF